MTGGTLQPGRSPSPHNARPGPQGAGLSRTRTLPGVAGLDTTTSRRRPPCPAKPRATGTRCEASRPRGDGRHAWFWWSCPLCADRMATDADPRAVEHDRDAHLAHAHPGALVEARPLRISHWPAGVRHVITV